MSKPTPLTDKEKFFCKEYIATKNLNATQAAISAGYAPNSARVTASRLLSKANIQKEISRLMDKRSEKVEVKAEDILKHLDILRSSNIDDYIELKTVISDAGNEVQVVQFKDFKDLTKEQLMCIESVKNTAHGIELKLHGKNWSIDQICKHIGFYDKDNKLALGIELSKEDKAARIAALLIKAKESK